MGSFERRAMESPIRLSDLEDYEREFSAPEAPPDGPSEAVETTDPNIRLLDAMALASAAMTVIGLVVAYQGTPSLGVPLMLVGGFALGTAIRIGTAVRKAPLTLRVFTRDAPPREPPP